MNYFSSRRHLLFPVAVVVVLAVFAALNWKPLSRWFGIGDGASSSSGGSASQANGGGAHRLPEGVTSQLQEVFGTYERVRALLAADTLEGLPEQAQGLAQGLEAARAAGAPEPLHPVFDAGAKASIGLRDATSVEAAREQFGHLSQALVTLAAIEPALQKGRHIFQCPMVEGFAKWFQTNEQMANPYMGKRMLKCGTRSDWGTADSALHAAAHAGAGGGADDVAHYTCPLCGMDLVPVTKGELQSGVVLVDDARRQRIGVKTAKVKRAPLEVSVRALGKVTWDETRLVDVTVRTMGWIQDLKVDATGQQVKKGQVLFTFYSPELLAAQQELLLAVRRSGDGAGAGAGHDDGAEADPLLRASRQRLRLWGLTDGQVERIISSGEPMENVPVLSPATGYVIEKEIVAGASVMPGMKLYRIAPLDRVWVEAEVYEQDLPHVRVGQPVTIRLPFGNAEPTQGKVSYIYPWLDEMTRTGKVRVSLPNKDGQLKPDMYANLSFRRELDERLQIPSSAVVYTGPRRLVFVDMGEDRLRPQVVELGAKGDDGWEVLSGLKEGDVVVTSGNFLIAAETRLRSGADWGAQP